MMGFGMCISNTEVCMVTPSRSKVLFLHQKVYNTEFLNSEHAIH